MSPAFRDVNNVARLQKSLVDDHPVQAGMLFKVRDEDVSCEEFWLEVILVGGISTPVVGGGDEANDLGACELEDPETSHGCCTHRKGYYTVYFIVSFSLHNLSFLRQGGSDVEKTIICWNCRKPVMDAAHKRNR